MPDKSATSWADWSDADRLREAAMWLRRACKDRLPVGHYAKLDEECRAIDAVLSLKKNDVPTLAAGTPNPSTTTKR